MSVSRLLLILLCGLCAVAQAQERTKRPPIDIILQEPEDSIEVGVACLSLAQEFYPDLNAEFFLTALDHLVSRFQKHFGHVTDPELRIRALNTFLFQKGCWNDSLVFMYDHSDPGAHRRDNRFINGYLSRRRGSCVTMPMLYVILGQRLGMSISAVRAPNHFFVRYFPKKIPVGWQANIEATSGGGYSSDGEYTIDMKIPKVGITKGMFLRTLTRKEYLASLLLLNVSEYIELKDFDKAERYAVLALRYDSTFATAVWARGLVHYQRAKSLEEKVDRGNYIAQINEHLRFWEESKAKAKAMGMAMSLSKESLKKQLQMSKSLQKEGGD